MEKEQSEPKKDKDGNPLNDDQAMAVFANYMAGDTSGLVDPAAAERERKKAAEEKKA